MKLKANLKISNVNVRREKMGEEEGPLAIDLTLTGPMRVDLLRDLFATQAAFDVLLGALYLSTGELACGDVDQIKLKTEAMNVECIVQVNDLEDTSLTLEDCRVNNISLEPMPGRVCELKLRVQANPGKEMISDIVQLLHESLDFDLTTKQLGLFDGQQEAGQSSEDDVNDSPD